MFGIQATIRFQGIKSGLRMIKWPQTQFMAYLFIFDHQGQVLNYLTIWKPDTPPGFQAH